MLKTGDLLLDGKSISLDTLKLELERLAQELSKPRIVLDAARELPYQTVGSMVAMVQGYRFLDVRFAQNEVSR
jgi:biopolymer transport protein ExbD